MRKVQSQRFSTDSREMDGSASGSVSGDAPNSSSNPSRSPTRSLSPSTSFASLPNPVVPILDEGSTVSDYSSQERLAEYARQKTETLDLIKRSLSVGVGLDTDALGSRERSMSAGANQEPVLPVFVDRIPVHSEAEKPGSFFQRVSISDAKDAVSDEVATVCGLLLEAGKLRDKYMYAGTFGEENWSGLNREKLHAREKELEFEAKASFRRRPEPPFEPFGDLYNVHDSMKAHALLYKNVDGVFQVFERGNEAQALHSPVDAAEFYADLRWLLGVVHDAAAKSFSYMRLQLLQQLFQLHVLLNGSRENGEQKRVPHRDFYNIRKVDTHIHHSACMNQKHLLRFIKHKLKHNFNEVVIERDEKFLTLAQVFQSLKLTLYDLSIDTLDMHADNTFHRFDRFNLKYNPIGESRLREIFLKTDNLLGGRYLAELTQEVFSDAEANKYVMLEPRLSIYGKSIEEWSKLSGWYTTNKLASPNVRWMIQIPRLYSVYKKLGLISSFQEMLTNIFEPLFANTLDPKSNPQVDLFLRHVIGFDCVDDESKFQRYDERVACSPAEWTFDENPPFSYWIYYIYANLCTLNHLRHSLGLSTFAFRPHAGEAGDLNNLAATFLCADGINHGILLRKSPTLQYLYYLKQIGLAISPLSNNKLFLDYHSSPFPELFAKGLNVSLSTDDPLMLHITKDPLVEEYSVAAQVWKLSSTDVCEIARNSVLQSGFEHPYKAHFIGENYTKSGEAGNDITQTNVPDIRVVYRKERLEAEWEYLSKNAQSS